MFGIRHATSSELSGDISAIKSYVKSKCQIHIRRYRAFSSRKIQPWTRYRFQRAAEIRAEILSCIDGDSVLSTVLWWKWRPPELPNHTPTIISSSVCGVSSLLRLLGRRYLVLFPFFLPPPRECRLSKRCKANVAEGFWATKSLGDVHTTIFHCEEESNLSG